MTTYGIYFTNNYSAPGENQDYALFCDVPIVSSSSGSSTPYSNVFLSKKLANSAHWDISITKNYMAWCGTSAEQLAPGVSVTVGMSKVATLGTTDSPGSTFAMYNNDGSPAFKPAVTYTSNPGAYEIDTDTDFTPNLNFVIGMAGTDDAGRMRPLASIAAPRNARVNISPVLKYYLAAYSATAGTVINTSIVSKVAATIDFSGNPGKYGAIVNQTEDGKFTVKYVSQAVFAMTVNPPNTLQLGQLQYYLNQIQEFINFATGNQARAWYACSAAWYGTVSNTEKLEIQNRLMNGMAALGYEYEGGGIEGRLLLTESKAPPTSLDDARIDFGTCYLALPMDLRRKVVDPQVSPVTEASSDPVVETSYPGDTLSLTEGDSLAEKKQRALRLLQDQGLSGALNGL